MLDNTSAAVQSESHSGATTTENLKRAGGSSGRAARPESLARPPTETTAQRDARRTTYIREWADTWKTMKASGRWK